MSNARQLIEGYDYKSEILASIPEDPSYEWRDYGIMGSDYFQGAGTAGTDWEAAYVGIGDNPREAAEDALDQACSDGWENLTKVSTADIPDKPSVNDQARSQARSEVADDILATGDEEAIRDAIDEILEQDDGGMSTYYHIALYVKNP